MAFFFAYSRKVQQRLRAKLGAKLSAKPLERLKRLRIGNLGVDVHRHVDLCMAQDLVPCGQQLPGRGVEVAAAGLIPHRQVVTLEPDLIRRWRPDLVVGGGDDLPL